jgi:hypothetical protein
MGESGEARPTGGRGSSGLGEVEGGGLDVGLGEGEREDGEEGGVAKKREPLLTLSTHVHLHLDERSRQIVPAAEQIGIPASLRLIGQLSAPEPHRDPGITSPNWSTLRTGAAGC